MLHLCLANNLLDLCNEGRGFTLGLGSLQGHLSPYDVALQHVNVLCNGTDHDLFAKRNRQSSMGIGCGSVGRAVASDTRGVQFESSHRQKFINIEHLNTVNCVLKRRK